MLDLVINARKASIAPGVNVCRILPFRLRRMVGPFIFFNIGVLNTSYFIPKTFYIRQDIPAELCAIPLLL